MMSSLPSDLQGAVIFLAITTIMAIAAFIGSIATRSRAGADAAMIVNDMLPKMFDRMDAALNAKSAAEAERTHILTQAIESKAVTEERMRELSHQLDEETRLRKEEYERRVKLEQKVAQQDVAIKEINEKLQQMEDVASENMVLKAELTAVTAERDRLRDLVGQQTTVIDNLQGGKYDISSGSVGDSGGAAGGVASGGAGRGDGAGSDPAGNDRTGTDSDG